MIPELFSIGSFSVSPFGLLMALAFLVSYFALRSGLTREGLGDDEDASALVLAAGLGGVLGSKLYYAILTRDWLSVFSRSGLVWYGGFILGAVAVVFVLRRRGMPLWASVDVIAPVLVLGYAVGRIGCFLVGDDYGVPTRLPWGVVFPYGLPVPTTAGMLLAEYGIPIPEGAAAADLVPVHPTQLYETVAGVGIFALAAWFRRRTDRPGAVGLATIGAFAVERFLVEFLRAKDDRFLGAFTVAQGLSVLVLAVVLVLYWRRRRVARGTSR